MRVPSFVGVLGVWLLLGTVCFGQLGSTHSLSLDATVTASGGATQSRSGLTQSGLPVLGGGTVTSNDYSQKRAKESRVSILVQVRNLGRAPDTAKLEWYFVANPVNKGKEYFFDTGSQDIAIAPAATEKFPLQSAPLASQTIKELHAPDGGSSGVTYIPTASVTKTGATIGGWIIRLVVDGKPYQVRASSPTLEALAKNDAALAAYPRRGR